MQTAVEQRESVRTELSWPVSVWLPNANRFFNGKSMNISKTGVYMKVPSTTPISQGNIVEINFPRTEALAQEKGSYSRIKCGRVVRVERKQMVSEAGIGLAIQFE